MHMLQSCVRCNLGMVLASADQCTFAIVFCIQLFTGVARLPHVHTFCLTGCSKHLPNYYSLPTYDTMC